jgi:hypothetical protein
MTEKEFLSALKKQQFDKIEIDHGPSVVINEVRYPINDDIIFDLYYQHHSSSPWEKWRDKFPSTEFQTFLYWSEGLIVVHG